MEKILREVLAGDESLLCRRDELIAALEKKVPANKSRDFASIKRALALNVGEKFFVGKTDKDATKTDVAQILKDGGLQASRIDFVIDTFVKALDWDKPMIPVMSDDAAKNDDVGSNAPSVAEVFRKARAADAAKNDGAQESTAPRAAEVLRKARAADAAKKTSARPEPKPTNQPSQPQSFRSSPTPTTKPATPPQKEAAPPVKKNFLIGLLCVFMLALFFAAGKSSNPSTTAPAPPTSSTANVQQAEETQSPPPEDTSYLNAKTDLSLNGMDLGISISEAEKILGRPNKIEKVDGYDRYIYGDNFYIAVINGKVDAFVTSDPKFKTLRGLHVGSSYSEVVDAYGTNSRDMQAGDLTLREYLFTSLDGKYALLRFAVDSNGRVDYISIRIVEEAPPKKEESSGIDENTKQAALAFLNFHKAITNRDYSTAFNLFTEGRKEEMNYNIRSFAQGYSDTITSEITNLELISSSSNRVVMEYVLDARDRAGGGRTLYQQFRGQVEMIKVGGEWKIGPTQSKRIKEVMER